MSELINCINTNIEFWKDDSIRVSKSAFGRNSIDKFVIKAEKLWIFANFQVFDYKGLIMTNGIEVVNHD